MLSRRTFPGLFSRAPKGGHRHAGAVSWPFLFVTSNRAVTHVFIMVCLFEHVRHAPCALGGQANMPIIGPPGVGDVCVRLGITVHTWTVRGVVTAVAPIAIGCTITASVGQSRSTSRGCKSRAGNRHRHILYNVPHDLISCGIPSALQLSALSTFKIVFCSLLISFFWVQQRNLSGLQNA